MYQITKTNNTPLLSNYNATFWSEYVNDFATYDKVFRRMYLDFKYFLQDGTEDVEALTTDFTEDVRCLLVANSKKYSELYRIYVVTDDEDMLVDNYSIVETMDKDTSSNTTGHDNRTKGLTDTETLDTLDTDNTQAMTTTVTDETSPYDDTDDFHNTSKSTTETPLRNNTLARTGTDTFTHNGTDNMDILRDNTGTEDYTLTRTGNIGVQTSADMLSKHEKFWSKYEFFTMIFKDICKELLIV